jgi:hypothetical protein
MKSRRNATLPGASFRRGRAEPRSRVSGRQSKGAQTGLRALLRANGLSLVLLMLFVVLLGGQAVSGMYEYNEEQSDHGEKPLGLADYLATGHFLEATAENWESEFLQMAAYVLLTVWLFQKGSSESKKLDEKEAVDRDPGQSNREDAPGPVRHGGWRLRLYEHSLSIAFLALFLLSFVLHAVGGAEEYSAEQRAHDGRGVSVLEYIGTARFWFESTQNWQSEFLALVSMVVLSIFLRERGSPESKPVDAPHSQTGSE